MLNKKKKKTSVSSSALLSGNERPHKIWMQVSLQVAYKIATMQVVKVVMVANETFTSK